MKYVFIFTISSRTIFKYVALLILIDYSKVPGASFINTAYIQYYCNSSLKLA